MNNELLDLLLDQLADRITSRLHHLQAALTPAPDSGTTWLSVKSAAAYLDWPTQRLYKLTAQGAIPHYKHDGRLLFHRHELDQWLQQYAQANDWIVRDKRAISR
jgi:excisionase family DNA binding protein